MQLRTCLALFIMLLTAPVEAGYPQRIISLAPHTTELIFAAGAGDRLIGVSAYSDYPEQAKQLPVIASAQQINIETILQLKPDLIIYWQQGNTAADISQLRQFGIPLYASKPGSLEDVALQIKQLGQLLGTQDTADRVSDAYLNELRKLRITYQDNPPLDLFYQVWPTPLMTVANDEWLQAQFELCGFNNVFKQSPVPYPVVNIEQVIVKQPTVIIAGTVNKAELSQWHKWQTIPAVRKGNLFQVDPDLTHRFTPRVLSGIKNLCDIALQVHQDAGSTLSAPVF